MLIGIVGYFTIPTVTGWIIQAGGLSNYSRNVSKSTQQLGNVVGAGAGAATGNVGGLISGKLTERK